MTTGVMGPPSLPSRQMASLSCAGRSSMSAFFNGALTTFAADRRVRTARGGCLQKVENQVRLVRERLAAAG